MKPLTGHLQYASVQRWKASFWPTPVLIIIAQHIHTQKGPNKYVSFNSNRASAEWDKLTFWLRIPGIEHLPLRWLSNSRKSSFVHKLICKFHRAEKVSLCDSVDTHISTCIVISRNIIITYCSNCLIFALNSALCLPGTLVLYLCYWHCLNSFY